MSKAAVRPESAVRAVPRELHEREQLDAFFVRYYLNRQQERLQTRSDPGGGMGLTVNVPITMHGALAEVFAEIDHGEKAIPAAYTYRSKDPAPSRSHF